MPVELSQFLLTLLIALGGAGLYLAMPGGRLRSGRVALIVLLGAAAALLALIFPLAPGGAQTGWFIALSVVGLVGGIRMVTHRRPVYSALYFVLVVVSVTGLLVISNAEFLAAALLIIYAGAILVTYVFVIMLAQQNETAARYDREARQPLIGILAGFVLLAVMGAKLLGARGGVTTPIDTPGRVTQVGAHLLTEYVIGVQIAGVLLLAAMVGAIAIARRKADELPEGGDA
jgi:NADH-quinone oxidoreductase subunit J